MSIANNRISAKVIKVKGFVFSILAMMVFTSMVNTLSVQAAVPIPSGFQEIASGRGVKVYRKVYTGGQPDFVTVVDLRYATLRSFVGWPTGEAVERRTFRTHWNNAVAQNTYSRTAKVAISGTFFAHLENGREINPTGISFGLKTEWWRVSYGFDVNKHPGKVLTFAFDPGFGSSSIQPYSRATFDAGIPDVVGGLDYSVPKPPNYTGRTFVGVRDDNRDGHSETVIFFSSKSATQIGAVKVLSGFGGGSKMMLDGGGSTGLIVDGKNYITPDRTLPHVFIIYAGK